jgi:hypothetical protein
MSLAMYAAPFYENDDNKNNDNLINKKRQTHNKTQKKYTTENFDTEKVNNVLQTIHQNSKTEDNEGNTLGDFNPPPKPESSGVQKTKTTENMINMSGQNMFQTLGRSPQPNHDVNPTNDLELNNFNTNYGDQKMVDEYYKKFVPNYDAMKRNSVNRPYYRNTTDNMSMGVNNQQDLLMQKLNYMINLLEEQQDEKTNNVTEEVVLYSFLGIFIIFIVDSFARVGKYVR